MFTMHHCLSTLVVRRPPWEPETQGSNHTWSWSSHISDLDIGALLATYQTPGSVLGLVGPVSICCDYVNNYRCQEACHGEFPEVDPNSLAFRWDIKFEGQFNDDGYNNRNNTERRTLGFSTTFSPRCKLSTIHMFKWPKRNHLQITCSAVDAYHEQRVMYPWCKRTAQ